METKIYKPSSENDKEIKLVGDILRNGGVVGIPTETVYGLAANALNADAVKKIFLAKGRPQDNPLIVHIADIKEIYDITKDVPEKALKLANAFWPGPLTIILKRSDIIPSSVSAGLDTVAIRMPSHPLARAIIRSAGVPLAAPSANTSGKPSPTTANHVFDDLNGKIDAIIDGGTCNVGVESTVISLCTNPPRLLRPGKITPAQLKEVIGEVVVDDAVLGKLKKGAKVASPGMKYKHYSPDCNVVIVRGSFENFKKHIEKFDKEDTMAICFNGEEKKLGVKCLCFGNEDKPEQQAHDLFDDLRKVDKFGAKNVFVRCPSGEGVGLAVMNRLLRAAEFEVIDV